MRVLTASFIGVTALMLATVGRPASAENVKSVVHTLNAIVNPEDAWRLEDQARRYRQRDEARYWHATPTGWYDSSANAVNLHPSTGRGGYQTAIGPDEAYRLQHQAHRFGHPHAEEYWQRWGEEPGR